MSAKDMTGLRFGSLSVIERAENARSGQARWICLCDCGNTVTARGDYLRNGTTKSCGCYKTAIINEFNRRHGGAGTRLYRIWQNMKDRCSRENNAHYSDYGGRGITVCEEWQTSFDAFRDWALSSGYDDSLTLDRRDNDGGYTPENCRWATRKEQANNQRSNRVVIFNGEKHTVSEWAEICGISGNALRLRLNRGWTVEAALGKARCSV